MPEKRWSLVRVALIWCTWPLVVAGLVVAGVVLTGGLSIDLIHLQTAPLRALVLFMVLLGPPVLATWFWGRRSGR
jgi:hypothetical protein